MSDRLQEVKLENKALRGTAADFERAKRAFGPEQVEAAKQREQADKARKRPRRSLDWGGR